MAAEGRRRDDLDRWSPPVLRARAGSPAERFAGWVGKRHPVAVFFAALLAGFAVLAGLSVLLGLFVTDVLLHTGGLAGTDESTIESIVDERTPFLTDASEVGSAVGGAPVLPILVGLVALVCAAMRKWRIAAFAVFVLVVESATYRVTSLLIPRDRPSVQRLEDLPVDASYPSGHTAASIAVYAGLVLLLTSTIRDRGAALGGLGGRRPAADRGGDVAHVPRHAPSARCGRRGARGNRRRAGPALRLPCRRGRRAGRRPEPRHGCEPGPRTGDGMKVAVVAHADKRLGGGLPELRRVLEAEGVGDPLWYEVPKAKRAPDQVRRALEEGADLVFAWGGDGTVRRCAGELVGEEACLAVLPAGTANLFALNFGIPADLEQAVDIGLHGARRRLDVGRFGDERFAVMAGVGFDAAMIRGAEDLKERIGRAAYLWSGSRSLRGQAFEAEIEVDGDRLVRRRRDLHPARQRRRAVRRRRCFSRRAAR